MPIYSDYLTDNYYLLHPSMAGISNCNKVRLTGRQQWFGDEDAPSLQTMSINGRIGETSSAVGAIFFNDKNGYHSQTGGYVTYAHHIMFSRNDYVDLNQLSFGLSFGLIQSRLDETQFDPTDFDPIIAGILQSTSYFNVDAGMSYNFLNFSGNFTIKNLASKMSFSEPAIYRHFKDKTEILTSLLKYNSEIINTQVGQILDSKENTLTKFEKILSFKF